MDKIVHQVNRLINKIAKGDKNALGELFSLTSRMLYFMARKYLIDKSYAEDLVSDVFLTVVKKAELFDLNQNGLNWLYKIIHNSIGIYINEDYKFEDVVTFTLNISDEKMIINKKA